MLVSQNFQRLVNTIVILVILCAGSAALAGNLDQRAAELYESGVRQIQIGHYAEGETFVRAALDRGASEPNDAQGSETRFLVRRYDPYYWLGVATMEQGRSAEALRYFETSERFVLRGTRKPVIARWPREYEDLKRRKAKLIRERQGENRD